MYNNENRKVRFAETFKQREEIKAEAENEENIDIDLDGGVSAVNEQEQQK
jgi:hypothetical protein